MTRTRRRERSRGLLGERGAALVEFALVLPVFLLLLFGMVDFGTVFNYWIDETHLTNKAARWAAVDKNPGDGVSLQDYIRQQANTDELESGLQVCITFPDGSAQVGDPVTATATYTYTFLPFLDDLVPGGEPLTDVTITGSATMRLEAPPTEYEAGCSPAGT